MRDHGADPDYYRFLSAEKVVVDLLIDAVRSLLARPGMSPKQLHYCAVLLHALGRLPLVTPSVGMTLCVVQPNTSAKFWMGLTIDDERFELDQGTTVHTEAGSDHSSESVIVVTTSGREVENRLGNLLGFVDMFRWMCESDVTQVDFDIFGGTLKDWDDAGDPSWWNRLSVCDKAE